MSDTGYVAFLRGVNVGGNALIKSSELKKVFESLGFANVTPLLASGNVVFQARKASVHALKEQIETTLQNECEIRTVVMVRSASQISQLVDLNPFLGSKLKPEIKVQITFFVRDTGQGAKFPMRIPSEDFQLVQVSPMELFSAVDMSTNARTPELMKLLEKRFGKEITTRTWNTIEKVAQLLAAS